MNKRFLTTTLLAGTLATLAGCSNDSPFDSTTNTSNNSGLISQNNFTILFSDPTPQYLDPADGSFTSVTSDISVQIGDNNNQLLTGSYTIQFRTEWGLIDPSCTTDDGGCSVTWRSGSPDTLPANLRNTIVAFASSGQESFGDINGNGIFDDGDEFDTVIYADVDEPYIDIDESRSFTPGDIVIDTINGVDLTGSNETHDSGDLLFNGPNCAHSTLCSTNRSRVTVWESGSMLLNGGSVVSVGGAITGLAGGVTLELQNDLINTQSITADGTFSYSILGGTDYNISISAQPAGQTCTFTNANNVGTASADITDIDINCI